MAMLDVSAALTNPYTLSTCEVWRRKQLVNNFGEGKQEVQRICGVRAVIYPANKNDLQRRPEAQVQANSIVVITRYSLRGESETIDGVNYQPDVIFWEGDPYLVVEVNDYGNYARGFIKVIAESMSIVDIPPMNKELGKQSEKIA